MKVVPFIFDQAFDAGAAEAAAQAEARFREELAAARAAAHAAGYEEGYAKAKQEIEAATLACLQTVAGQIGAVMAEVQRVKMELTTEAAGLVMPVAEAIAGIQIRTHPLAVIETLMLQIFEEHSTEPRLVIRVADVMLDSVKARIDELASMYGFQGRLIFLAEPTLAPGDCLIEWPDGGVEARSATRLAEVREKAETFLTSLQHGAQFEAPGSDSLLSSEGHA